MPDLMTKLGAQPGMALCRQFRHDGLGELLTAVTNFKTSGGIASLLPQHGRSRQQNPLPTAKDDSLQVYPNVKVEDLIVPPKGPGSALR